MASVFGIESIESAGQGIVMSFCIRPLERSHLFSPPRVRGGLDNTAIKVRELG